MSAVAPPIVFVQRGTAFYFPTVLVQAVRRCTSSRLFLISDVDPTAFLPAEVRSRVNWIPMAELADAADEFRRHYVHLSVNRPWLEQFCFERWFMIRALCSRESLPSVVHLDSDVLVESDVASLLRHCRGATVMFSRRMGPHIAYFPALAALEALCTDILDTYRSPAGIVELRRAYQAIRDRGQMGSISDMYFFERLAVSAAGGYADTFEIRDNAFFDHSMGMGEGYRKRFGIKVVRHRDNQAFCFHIARGEWVRVLALHFQGVTKIWMARHADVESLRDAVRSAALWCHGAVSYASRAHRYLLRKWTVLWRRINARPTSN